jgi:hypothetical protein
MPNYVDESRDEEQPIYGGGTDDQPQVVESGESAISPNENIGMNMRTEKMRSPGTISKSPPNVYGRSGDYRTPGVSFLDETIMNWADDISLYGGTFAASFNRLPNEIDEEPEEAAAQESYIESALSPIRESYIANDVKRGLTYANGSFWDHAKLFAADMIRPKVLVEASLAGGAVSGISKMAQAVPILERLGAGVAEWASATTGGAAKYLGAAAKGASEVAMFEGVDLAGEALVELPVENIGDHMISSAMLGAGGGVVLKGLSKVGGKFKDRFFDSKKEFLNDLNEGLVYPEREFNCEIVAGPKGEPLLSISPERLETGVEGTVSAGAMAAPKFKPVHEIFTWGPLAQSWNSESQVVRQMSEAYFGNMYSRTETGGVASVMDMMQSDRGVLAQFTSEYKKHFKVYKDQYKKTGLSSKEIKEAFEQDWINAATEGGYSSNPTINGLVSEAKKIFKDYGRKGVEAKVFGDFEAKIGRANELYEHNIQLAEDLALKAEDLTLVKDVKKTSKYFKELGESAEKEAKTLEEAISSGTETAVSEETLAFLDDVKREAREYKALSKNLDALKDFPEQRRFFKEKAAYTRRKALNWQERAQGQESFRKRVLEKDYYPQYVDKNRITQDREGWLRALEDGIRSKNPTIAEDKLKAAIDDIDQSMYWNADPKFNADGTSRPGSAKTREIRFDQQYIKDYLNRDPLSVMNSYITSMGYKIAENTTLNRLGFSDFKVVKEAFLKEQGGHLVDEKAINASKLLDSIPLIVSGQFDAKVRRGFDESVGGEWLRSAIGACQSLNVARYLGSLGISGAVDLAANFAKGTTCRHIGGLIKHVMGKEIGGLTREEAVAAGFCVDDMLANIRHISEEGMFTDLTSKLGYNINKLREGISSVSEKVIHLSGIHFIDGSREKIAASLNALDIGAKILSGSRKVGKLEGEVVDRIKGQLEKYRIVDKDGVEFYNLSMWDDRAARLDFEGEIRRGVRSEIFKPNIGDIPNALRHPLAKVFSMFYSFGWGMWNSIMLPMAMSGRGGQLALLSLGTLGYEMLGECLRKKIRGEEVNWDSSEEWRKIGFAAAEKTPVIGHLASGVNVVTFGQLGEYTIKSGSDLAAKVLRGGNVGSVMADFFDAGKAIGNSAFSNKPMTKKEAKKMIKILPFQNNWAIRPLFNIMIDDLPENSRRKKR